MIRVERFRGAKNKKIIKKHKDKSVFRAVTSAARPSEAGTWYK